MQIVAPSYVKMVLVDDNGTEGFSFIWTIQNFSYCLQQHGECLLSPLFVVETLDQIKWCLALYPRGHLNPTTIGLYLRRVSNEPFPIAVNFVLSICQVNGMFKKLEARKDIFDEAKGYGSPCSLTLAELFESGVYLENGALTVRCRMWGSKVELSEKCYAKTIIGVERTLFVWNLESFLANQSDKKRKRIRSTSSETPSFTIDLLWSGTSAERKLQVEIRPTKTKNIIFSACELSLLDSGGKIVHFVREKHFFTVSESVQFWEFAIISKKILLSWERTYLPNSTPSLRCEFIVSIGVKYNQVERTEFGITSDHQIRSNQATDLVFPGSWKDDLQCFYAEGKFSDFTIRTPNTAFPVHKAILCARSGVFRKMFEQDMKESRTGVVEIEDLDDDIVSKLLRFLYTDSVEELEWETASKLFFAADKYELMALKRKCSVFLKARINTSNVCTVLVLADAHQDQDLKSASQDFIGDHASDILSSEEWKKFMQDQLQLASETMHLLFLRNLKSDSL